MDGQRQRQWPNDKNNLTVNKFDQFRFSQRTIPFGSAMNDEGEHYKLTK
jgi:hypothetical protein